MATESGVLWKPPGGPGPAPVWPSSISTTLSSFTTGGGGGFAAARSGNWFGTSSAREGFLRCRELVSRMRSPTAV